MNDFEPRMDKWRSGDAERAWGMQFKDAIANKGRVEKTRRQAQKKAERRVRWKRSWLGRFTAFIKRMIGWAIGLFFLYLAVIFCIAILQLFGVIS